MTHINNGHGHLTHHFVVISPGVEKGIEDRDKDKEDQHTLILDGGLHLLCPDVTGIVNAFINLS